MLYLASDHGGFRKKQALAAWLRKQAIPFRDLGPSGLNPTDDYPIWSARIARIIQRQPNALGIVLCRSGVGMALVANKFSGIRAVQGYTPAIARQSRKDENTNVLSLAADYQSLKQMTAVVQAWVKTPFRPVKRHQRRLRQIARIEHAN